jgi:thiamine biosynthesis protein ThiS
MAVSTTNQIEIVLNGEPRVVPAGLNLEGLLSHLEIAPDRVAVELDRAIVPKASWGDAAVANGSTVEIVQFVGGG